MHFTVQFDHQFGTGAVKIHNVPSKRFLPQKPHALETLALTAAPSGLGASHRAKPATVFLRLALDSAVVIFEARACTAAISQQNLKPKSIAATQKIKKAPFSPGREGLGMRGEEVSAAQVLST
jgi:hypothetical protein